MSINNNNDINININVNFILGLLVNSLKLLYNIPFVYQVYKNNDTKNISTCFLLLRNLGSLSWLSYGILEKDNWIILSYDRNRILTFSCDESDKLNVNLGLR